MICLGVDAEAAEQDACRTEHEIIRETFEKLKLYSSVSVTSVEGMGCFRCVK